jgi:hypothetical protein
MARMTRQGDDNDKSEHSTSIFHATRHQEKEAACLKGLSHEIFEPVYWPIWIHLGLNENRFWFLNFKEAPSI